MMETMMMRFTLCVPLLLLVAALLPGCGEKGASPGGEVLRPNIIHIMADDLGYGDLGSYGQQLLQTPHLDQLAAEGMRFTQFYAGSAACTPSRYALVTGKHAGTSGVTTNRIDSLPEGVFTVGQLLQRTGYRTGLVGKWALGGPGSHGFPLDVGFDYFYGYPGQRLAHNYYPEKLMENRDWVELTGNLESTVPYVAQRKVVNAAERIHQAALAFIKRNRDTPFYLQLDYNLPHVNNHLAKSTGNGYEHDGAGRYADKDWTESEKGYGEMVGLIDDYVGELIALLRAQGLDDNTLVIFTSDNGPAGVRTQESLSKFNATGGLRGNKGTLHEGGIRVPMIAWWPGRVPFGTNDRPLALWDWMSTVAELSGANTDFETDGVSYADSLAGLEAPAQQTPLYWAFNDWLAVRLGPLKWVKHPNGREYLFDIEQDPGERHNLLRRQPDRAEALRAIAEAYGDWSG